MFNILTEFQLWRERQQILRDLRREKADKDVVDRFKIKDQLTFALSALQRNDRWQAVAIWERLVATYPRSALRTAQALDVMLRLRRFDEATDAVRAGMQQAPGDYTYFLTLTRISEMKGDREDALKQYALLRKRFPGVVEGYSEAAACLREIGRLDDAEALALAAQNRFVNALNGYLEYARVAVARKDWAAALQRWATVRDKFGWVGAWTGTAQALAQLGRHGEADEVLESMRFRFGSEPSPFLEAARLAEDRGDTAEALRRWKQTQSRFPVDPSVVITVSEALVRLGEPQTAEANLRELADRFPDELRPAHYLAKFLHDGIRNYSAAADAWAELRRRAPDNMEAWQRGADALERAGRSEEAAALRRESEAQFKPA